MLATVVLCDIRDSRKIKDRGTFGRRLHDALQDLNAQHDALIARFAVQAGIDEFAGIVETAACGEIIARLWFGLYPHAVRCSVVTGMVDIQGINDQAGQLPLVYEFDGPAFHQAADQLESMQQTEQLFSYLHTGLDVWQAGLISGLGDLLYAQMLDWTQRQQQIISRYRVGGNQTEVADSLGVSQSVISRSLSAIDYSRFSRALITWQQCFPRLGTPA